MPPATFLKALHFTTTRKSAMDVQTNPPRRNTAHVHSWSRNPRIDPTPPHLPEHVAYVKMKQQQRVHSKKRDWSDWLMLLLVVVLLPLISGGNQQTTVTGVWSEYSLTVRMKTPGVINVVVEATKNGKSLHTVTSSLNNWRRNKSAAGINITFKLFFCRGVGATNTEILDTKFELTSWDWGVRGKCSYIRT